MIGELLPPKGDLCGSDASVDREEVVKLADGFAAQVWTSLEHLIGLGCSCP